jgi:hypothetical protein
MQHSSQEGLKNVKQLGLLVTAIFLLTAQTSAVAPAGAKYTRHLVYQFGYNTPVASSGKGTGTTTIDISYPTKDGGLSISGSDFWWNTVRARATNTCEIHPNGNVMCSQAPNAISPMQLTIFPLLAVGVFKSLNAAGTSTWSRSYKVYAAIVPGASGFAGTPYNWQCSYNFQGKGPMKNAASLVLVDANGTLAQQGGTYLKAKSMQTIAYEPAARLAVVVTDQRTHIPYRSVNSNDVVGLKLLKDSGIQSH